MAKAYDRDLRVRVVAAIEAGATGEAASERYGIGKAPTRPIARELTPRTPIPAP
jgi:hypothetical protein